MREARVSPAPRTLLPTNRRAISTNTLPRRISYTAPITVHFTAAHIVAIKRHSAPAHALLWVQLINAMFSARSSPRYNQLLRRSQRLVSHGRANPSDNTIEKP